MQSSLYPQLSSHKNLEMENLKKILRDKLHMSEETIAVACATGELGTSLQGVSEAERIALGFRLRDQ